VVHFGNAPGNLSGCLVAHHQERNGPVVQLLSGCDGGLRARRRNGSVKRIRYNER
jgi:hypothetical protein